MQDKKGMLMFHWILVIIVGAIIIIFGIIFATKTGGVEKTKENILVAEYVDLMFNPFSSVGAIAQGFGKEVELPINLKAEISCQRKEEVIRVGSGKNSATEKIENIVYIKSKFDTNNMLIFSKPFNMPFRITDLIYAFPKEDNFCLLFDKNNVESERVVDKVIDEISSNFLNSDNLIKCDNKNCCEGKKNARIISFSKEKGEVRIIGENGKFDYGIVEFEKGKSYFIGTELIEAAIFSDYEVYDCNFRRLMDKISPMSEIYIKKTQFLASSQSCSYNNLRTEIQGIKSISDSLSSSPSLGKVESLHKRSLELREKNRNFICAQVY